MTAPSSTFSTIALEQLTGVSGGIDLGRANSAGMRNLTPGMAAGVTVGGAIGGVAGGVVGTGAGGVGALPGAVIGTGLGGYMGMSLGATTGYLWGAGKNLVDQLRGR